MAASLLLPPFPAAAIGGALVPQVLNYDDYVAARGATQGFYTAVKGRVGVHDPVANTVMIPYEAWGGTQRTVRIAEVNKSTGALDDALVENALLTDDAHGSPAAVLNQDRRVAIFHSERNGDIQQAVMATAGDIASFTPTIDFPVLDYQYPSPVSFPTLSNGWTLAWIAREDLANTYIRGSSAPDSPWSSPRHLVGLVTLRAYHSDLLLLPDGRLCWVWMVTDTSNVLESGRDIYVSCYDPVSDQIQTLDGTVELGTFIDSSSRTNYRIDATAYVFGDYVVTSRPTMLLDSSGALHVVWAEGNLGGNREVYHWVWDGSSATGGTKTQVTTGTDVNLFSVALNEASTGELIVAYYDRAGAGGVYTVARAADGSAWGTPVLRMARPANAVHAPSAITGVRDGPDNALFAISSFSVDPTGVDDEADRNAGGALVWLMGGGGNIAVSATRSTNTNIANVVAQLNHADLGASGDNDQSFWARPVTLEGSPTIGAGGITLTAAQRILATTHRRTESLPGTVDFTFECAFTPSSVQTGAGQVMAVAGQWEYLDSDRSWMIRYDVDGGSLDVFFSSDGTFVDFATNRIMTAPWTPVAGTRYSVCLERSGTTLRLYLDGVMVAKVTGNSAGTYRSTQPFMLGSFTRDNSAAGQLTRLVGTYHHHRWTYLIALYDTDGSYSPPTTLPGPGDF